MLTYIPKKSKEIYDEHIAHRGFHLAYPENTLSAYAAAVEKKLAIELDIRMTKDGHIICLHDRYTKRLLGTKGKTSNKELFELQKEKVLNTDEKVPQLHDVLKIVNAKTPILIEVKGFFNKEYESNLLKIIKNYNGKLYFHAKNIFTYAKLRKIFGEKTFWVLNPFRKRFNFIKNKQYKKIKADTIQ